MKKILISVVIPCYCSENSIQVVVNNLVNEFNLHGDDYQIILVNDNSPDKTFEIIKKMCKEDSHIMAINLSRNYGQQAARMAATSFLKGDYAVYMDDDGQHPVSGIYKMISKLKEGSYDVVYACFRHKKHSIFKRIISRINSWTLNFLVGKSENVRKSSFFVVRQYVYKEMERYKSPFPYYPGFLMQITTNMGDVELEHHARIDGKHTTYTLRKLLSVYLMGVTGFSVVPLRFSAAVGLVTAGIGFCAGLYRIIFKIFYPAVSVGYTSLIATILFTSGMLMMMLGIVGEYVGRIYMTANNLPQYTIKEVIGQQESQDEGNDG